jgi:hypothetical protein
VGTTRVWRSAGWERFVLACVLAAREVPIQFDQPRGTQHLDIMRDAGVDLEQPAPVEAAMQRFGELVGELEELL